MCTSVALIPSPSSGGGNQDRVDLFRDAGVAISVTADEYVNAARGNGILLFTDPRV